MIDFIVLNFEWFILVFIIFLITFGILINKEKITYVGCILVLVYATISIIEFTPPATTTVYEYDLLKITGEYIVNNTVYFVDKTGEIVTVNLNQCNIELKEDTHKIIVTEIYGNERTLIGMITTDQYREHKTYKAVIGN